MLLNTEDLELHIMPADLAGLLVLTGKDRLEALQAEGDAINFLHENLLAAMSAADSVPMSSVVLVQALLNPELASEKQVFTPPENVQRKVWVYSRADTERMKKDLLRSFERYPGS
jgi:hypothetical protein